MGGIRGDGEDEVEPPERIARWEAFGGTWSVASATDRRAVIELRRCDGGEIVERIDSADPAIVRWAAAQRTR